MAKKKDQLEELSSDELKSLLDKETNNILSSQNKDGNIDSEGQVKKKSNRLVEIDNPYEQFKNYKDPVAARYRKKMFVNFFLSLSIVTLCVLTTVAYLSSLVGNLTVQLERDHYGLTMSEDVYFETKTTRLRAESAESTYAMAADELPNDSEIDPLQGGTHNGVSELYGGSFMAYTFFIRNVGTRATGYDFHIKIEDLSIAVETGVTIDEVIRLRLYKNVVVYNQEDGLAYEKDQTHEMTTYAKQRIEPVKTDETDSEVRECISRYVIDDDTGKCICTGEKDYNKTFANTFYDEEFIMKANTDIINIAETVRFTVVIWIDGYDLEATGNVPSGAGIELSMYIALRDLRDDNNKSEMEDLNRLNETQTFTNIMQEDLQKIIKFKNSKKEVKTSEEY